MGRSREGAWIEIADDRGAHCAAARRSREGAWIEMLARTWLTFSVISRSREGAWIEIEAPGNFKITHKVAPARERGLKCT